MNGVQLFHLGTVILARVDTILRRLHAVTRRMLAAQDGPAILVGHSYGGAVITEAGTDPKVAGLVYIAAFAPDKGEVRVRVDQEPGFTSRDHMRRVFLRAYGQPPQALRRSAGKSTPS